MKISKLKTMNEKLMKELKNLQQNLDKTAEKQKISQKSSNVAENEKLKNKQKELENVQKQVKSYQKEINSLKEKLDAKTGYEKIIDLENKLKEVEMRNADLSKQQASLEQILKNQEKELEKIRNGGEGSTKLKALNEQLKTVKEKNKELEKKITAESASYQKQHTQLLDLQEKVQELRERKIKWKKAIADKLPAPPDEDESNENKKNEEEVLQASLLSLQKRLKMEKASGAKALDAGKAEIAELQVKVKEAEQEQKLNTAKLSELKKMMRHNQLKPIEDSKDLPHSTLLEPILKSETEKSQSVRETLETKLGEVLAEPKKEEKKVETEKPTPMVNAGVEKPQ